MSLLKSGTELSYFISILFKIRQQLMEIQKLETYFPQHMYQTLGFTAK